MRYERLIGVNNGCLMINPLVWVIFGLTLSAVAVFLIGLFHYLNSVLGDGLYDDQLDDDYSEYSIWKKL